MIPLDAPGADQETRDITVVGAEMFEEPGVDVDGVASIERDQFVYFTEMERQLNDDADWTQFRRGLVEAIAAAFGWSATRLEAALSAKSGVIRMPRRGRASRRLGSVLG